MTIYEAARESGWSLSALYRKIAEKKFLACKPRGRKGGWDINESSFRNWVKSNREATSNR